MAAALHGSCVTRWLRLHGGQHFAAAAAVECRRSPSLVDLFQVFSPKFEIESRSSRVQWSRSSTVKMPFSSRQFVVRTERPNFGGAHGQPLAEALASVSAADSLMRVRVVIGGVPPR